MEEALQKFAEQFTFEPKIENGENFIPRKHIVVGGMGGSHLAAGLLKMSEPDTDLYIHRDYGLPPLSYKKFADSLFVASSYSGNTEETLDFAAKAFTQPYVVGAVGSGGALLEFARTHKIPFIQLPKVGIQPRVALGFSLLALATFSGNEKLIAELKTLHSSLQPLSIRKKGGVLAEELRGSIPVVYSSRAHFPLAQIWKIAFNETAKIPSFCNAFPELNHNEMTGFDVIESTKGLNEKFHFIFLKSESNHPKILRRMEVAQELFEKRGFRVSAVSIDGRGSYWHNTFENVLLAEWTALTLSGLYGTETEQVPMIEEFKKLIA